MRLQLIRDLPAAPERVWPYVTEPELINRWSTAAVQPLLPGDQGRASTVGTLRRVRIPARPLPLQFDEVVEHADPPERFVYRVVGQRMVRHHRGEITLRRGHEGTLLVWEVEFDFAVAAFERAVRGSLMSELEASVSRLAAVVGDGGEPPPAPGSPNPIEEDVSEPLAAARRVWDQQRTLADDLRGRGDPRHWFARVYQHVTGHMVEACGPGGTVTHKGWALRLIPRFHDHYVDNLRRGQAEPHWRKAFDAIERAEGSAGGSSALAFWAGLVEGARAHIEGDLPRVLADVYRSAYANRCDYARFRADFLLMAPLLSRAWNALVEDVPAAYFPAWLRTLRRLLPEEAVEVVTARRYYDPAAERRTAFERGRELAEDAQARDRRRQNQ